MLIGIKTIGIIHRYVCDSGRVSFWHKYLKINPNWTNSIMHLMRVHKFFTFTSKEENKNTMYQCIYREVLP